MSSCEEAKYYLENCGLTTLDADGDECHVGHCANSDFHNIDFVIISKLSAARIKIIPRNTHSIYSAFVDSQECFLLFIIL